MELLWPETVELGVSVDDPGVDPKVLPEPTVDTVDVLCGTDAIEEATDDRMVAESGREDSGNMTAASEGAGVLSAGLTTVLTPSDVIVVT